MPLSSLFYSEETEVQGGVDTGCCHRCPCRVSRSQNCSAYPSSPHSIPPLPSRWRQSQWDPRGLVPVGWPGGRGTEPTCMGSLPSPLVPEQAGFIEVLKCLECHIAPPPGQLPVCPVCPAHPGELGQPLHLFLRVSNPRPLLWSSQSSVALVPQLSVEWPAEASLHLVGGG